MKKEEKKEKFVLYYWDIEELIINQLKGLVNDAQKCLRIINQEAKDGNPAPLLNDSGEIFDELKNFVSFLNDVRAERLDELFSFYPDICHKTDGDECLRAVVKFEPDLSYNGVWEVKDGEVVKRKE